MKIEELSVYELLEEYEYAVKRDHYDPINSREPKFSKSELRREVIQRIEPRKLEPDDEDD